MIFIWLVLGSLLFAPRAFAADSHTIKFSTLAPEGSSWMIAMRELAKEASKASEGRLKFKFYPGGVSGDEKDVIRKMRIGQLHSAGFTGVGLGEILREVRVLDLPFLFESEEEIVRVYDGMTEYFAEQFEGQGYVLLGWVPVGWVHFFSVEKIASIDDLKRARPWMWAGDPLVNAMYKAMNVSPIPLSINDVLMSLQTRMVDTVYSSPQGALALQWFSKVRYMTRYHMGYATGGVLMTKRAFDRLPDDLKKILKDLSAKRLKALTQTIHDENLESIRVMQENGVKMMEIASPEASETFRQAGKKARQMLTGDLFSEETLRRVESLIGAAR
ncbi:MAG: ABC transporter substrate-binding protein [Candidatus Nitrohelix vancouverensis]|uniref:ABC transporter substrate-binding protein n=1 Tax=Candidatus Nitrohelix vancouverensis TaxID=2705534 RepID=A0A7T0C2R6_9BACT|nr:MAG: ABC transporter substrate-binding protein [Candidatus Nitrohelix vancouverensis]